MRRVVGRRRRLLYRMATVTAVGAASVAGQAVVSSVGAAPVDRPAPAVAPAANHPTSGKASHLTLRRAVGAVELRDDASGALVQSQPAAAGAAVVVNGAPNVDTTLTVDVGDGPLELPGGISYHGGDGGFNTLAVRAGAQPAQSDAKNAHDGTVTVGGTTIAYSNLAPIDFTSTAPITLNLNVSSTKVDIVDGALSNGSPATEVNDGGTNAFEKMDVQTTSSLTVNGPGSAATWTLNNPTPIIGSLNVQGRNGGETFNMVTTSVPTLLLANATGADTFNLATTAKKATVVGSTGNDTFNVTAVSGELDLIGGGGSDAVSLGRQVVANQSEPKVLADIQGLVQLDEGNSGGHMGVKLDDSGRTTQPSGGDATLDTSSNGTHPSFVSLPNSGIVAYDSSVNNLEVDGGGAGSVFVAKATSAPTTIKSGTGNDIVAVGATAAAGPLTIDGQTGHDTVLVGDASTFPGDVLPDKVLGDVSISNVETVSVDDSADATARTASLTNTGITGLTTGALTYAGVLGVAVKGGSGADTFSVTPAASNEFTVDGGPPSTSPGDTLDVDRSDPTIAGAALTSNGSSSGTWTFSNRANIAFSNTETLTPAPTSISVAPATASIVAGTTQPFTATGHYAAVADADLTHDASWASDSAATATVSQTGVATGVAAGTANISATVGNVSGAAALTVTPSLNVTASPADQAVTYGQTATFTAAASGTPAPTVQWQVSTGGGPFTDIAGANSTTYSFVPTVSQSGNKYQAVFTNSGGSVTSTAATLTVNPAPLTVAAPSPTMTYGGQVPTLAPNYSGFVNNDTETSLTSQATCNTTATSSSPVGTYPVTCSGAVDPNYTFTYNPGNLAIGPAPLTVTADNQSIVYGAAIPSPLAAHIAGFVNGDTASVVSGTASCTTTATTASPAASYPISCTAGTLTATNYKFTNFVPGTLAIAKHPATVGYTGGLFFSTGSATAATANISLRAQVVQQANGAPGDLTKASVRFLLYSSSNTAMTTPDKIVSATVDSTGNAQVNTTLGIDNWTVVAQVDPANGFFSAPDADAQALTVYQPTTGIFATGGGWIVDPSFHNMPVAVSSSNNHGSFGFVVRYDKKGSPQGQSVYTFRGANGYDYVIKSTSWQGGGASFSPNTVSFGGKAAVTVIDPATGLVVAALSGGNYAYRVDATSGSSPSYAISVYTPSGVLYHQAGTQKTQIRLGGGNIIVHNR